MVQTRHQSAVRDHVPGTKGYCHFAVGDIVTAVSRQPLHWAQLKNFLVIFRQVRGAGAANGDVVNPVWLIPTLLQVTFPNIGDSLLREIELITVGIVSSQTRKWNV